MSWTHPTALIRCPECKVVSSVVRWAPVEDAFSCEDCGTHSGHRCPHCGEVVDDVLGLDMKGAS